MLTEIWPTFYCSYDSIWKAEPVEEYDELRLEELKVNCTESNIQTFLYLSYSNSSVSVALFLTAAFLLIKRLKRQRDVILKGFFWAMIGTETISVMGRNLLQKIAYPIQSDKAGTTGFLSISFAKTYGSVFTTVLEEILLSTFFYQNVLLITANLIIILNSKNKRHRFMYLISFGFYVFVQSGYLALKWTDFPVSCPLYPFIPNALTLATWILVHLLGNYIIYKIYHIAEHPMDSERNVSYANGTFWIAALNVFQVYTRATAIFFVILTWKIASQFVAFQKRESDGHADVEYYEGYVMMIATETTKYLSAVKMLVLLCSLD